MTGGQVRTRLMVDGTMMVELRGRLDPVCATALRDQLSADVLAMRPSEVVVDLEPVTFMHSTALSALKSVRYAAESIGASMRVVNTVPSATERERQPVVAG